jgi:hypothetical protein
MILAPVCKTPSYGALRHVDVGIDTFNVLSAHLPKNVLGFYEVDKANKKPILASALIAQLPKIGPIGRSFLEDLLTFAERNLIFVEFVLAPGSDPLAPAPYRLQLTNCFADTIAVEIDNGFCAMLATRIRPVQGFNVYSANGLRTALRALPDALAPSWSEDIAKIWQIVDYVLHKNPAGGRIVFIPWSLKAAADAPHSGAHS